MRTVKMLFKQSPSLFVLATLLTIAGGGVTVGLLAVINRVLKNGSYSAMMVWLFIALCLTRILTSSIGHMLIIRLSEGATHDMSLRIVSQILQAPFREIEKIGHHRLMAILGKDITIISGVVVMTPYQLVNVIIVLGSLVYLGIISWHVCFGILVVGGFGIASFSLPIILARRYIHLAREETDSLHKHFRSAIEGIKEFKLHQPRQDAFIRYILRETASKVKKYQIRGITIYALASHWNRLLFFIYVGLLIFVKPSLVEIRPAELMAYILVLLYMMAPLEAIQNALGAFIQADVAIKRVRNFGLSLIEEKPDSNVDLSTNDLRKYNTVRLEGIVYSYHTPEDDSHFKLGPISLTFNSNELVFLVGGNGSGKSTLVKVLVGLYKPDEGEIYLDDMLITDKELGRYRQQFTVVFQDFWLLESLLGLEGHRDLDRDANRWLELLQLDKKVKVKNGNLSTVELSRGQKKRLALLTGLMEDRPFYVFDEWAADQDPVYRQVFYKEVLPNLKKRGKMIIVITHDDRYWHLADRLIKFDSGQISDIRSLYSECRQPQLSFVTDSDNII